MNNDTIISKTNRIRGIDFIKAIAALFVVILHTNGYILPSYGFEKASIDSYAVYWSFEGIAFIAVPLFVLAGSYLMCSKEQVKLTSIIRIWLTTLIITVVGFFVSLFMEVKPGLVAYAQCFFPISLRAYGYVSSYILLMLLSPFLNIVIKKLDNRQLYYVTALLILINVIFPTIISFIGWGENYSVLFVCLYFVAASIKRINDNYGNNIRVIWVGLIIWVVSTIVLIGSPYIIRVLENQFVFLHGKEDYFYSYHNLVVMLESVGLFIAFTNRNKTVDNNRLNRIATKVSKCSLVIYLFHMHPIIKRIYPELNAIKQLYSDCWIVYLLTILGVSLTIYLIGVGIGLVIDKPVSRLTTIITQKVSKSNRIMSFLTIGRISVV